MDTMITKIYEQFRELPFPDDLPATLSQLSLAFSSIQSTARVLPTLSIASTNERIYLFKVLLPQIVARYLFLQSVAKWQIAKPPGPRSEITNSLNYLLGQITERRLINPLYGYFVSEGNIGDQYLFLPGHVPSLLEEEAIWWLLLGDLPIGTWPFARIHADTMLENWALRELQLYSQPGLTASNPNFKWTGTLAALTELIYGLNEMGVLGGKRNDIQPVKLFFEKVFDVSLGNIYKTYEHNRIRKKNRTPFLDGLKTAALRRMEEDDLNAL